VKEQSNKAKCMSLIAILKDYSDILLPIYKDIFSIIPLLAFHLKHRGRYL